MLVLLTRYVTDPEMLVIFGGFATLLLSLATSASAIDLNAFGERALSNLNKTPTCAQMCILNPKWARTYAPECANIPLGVKYGRKLCQNFMYQAMLDNCFKEKCSNPEDRKKVILANERH